jgi:hypothetical protein
MNFDSNEELYFSWWLDELVESGFVLEYKRGSEFLLSDSVKATVEVEYQTKKRKETKTKLVEKHLLGGHIYTADFNVLFRPSFAEKCGFNHDSGLAIIEIKNDHDANNMTRLFKVNQKWIYQKYGMIVNLVKIPSFFKNTFTPERYLLTDKTMKPRKLKYKPRLLKQFLEEL